jgi:hypothetical protein
VKGESLCAGLSVEIRGSLLRVWVSVM